MRGNANRDLRTWLPVAAMGLLVAAVAAPMEAGLRYRFTFDHGPTGTVWADGARCRVEFAPADPAEPATAEEAVQAGGTSLYDLMLDDGTERTYVDSAGKSWWSASEEPPH